MDRLGDEARRRLNKTSTAAIYNKLCLFSEPEAELLEMDRTALLHRYALYELGEKVAQAAVKPVMEKAELEVSAVESAEIVRERLAVEREKLAAEERMQEQRLAAEERKIAAEERKRQAEKAGAKEKAEAEKENWLCKRKLWNWNCRKLHSKLS